MLYELWRLFVGGCQHNYQLLSCKEIRSRYDGSMISIDHDGKYVTHELYTMGCGRCGKISTQKVNQVSGRVSRG
ncbi:hypothetical protein [Pseudomonas phage D6]|nr:hypothetical protein [Pseudomonas phage D6]